MRLGLVGFVAALVMHVQAAAQTPAAEIVSIRSGDDVMFGAMFKAEQAGPRPTAVLLTGHPGVGVYTTGGRPENVLGLAGPLQRAGFNVLAISFRGSWGSGGRYGVVARIEDVHAALAFVREQASTYRVDTARVLVVGWSMGGFNALVTSVEDRDVGCTVAIAPANYGARRIERMRQESAEPATLDDAIPGLSGFTGRDLRREIIANQPRLHVAARMEALAGRPLLIVQAEQDETVPPGDVQEHVEAARTIGAQPFDHVLIDANHGFNREGNRSELAAVVVNWVTAHCQ